MITDKTQAEDLEIPNPLNREEKLKDFFMVYKDSDGMHKLFMQAGNIEDESLMLFNGVSAIADILVDQKNFPMASALGVKIRDAITDFATSLQGLEERLKEQDENTEDM